MRKKHILFLIESLSGGGAEKVLSVLLKYINKENFEVTLCSVVDVGVYTDSVKSYVKYVSILKKPKTENLVSVLWYKLKYKLVYQILPMKLVYQLFVPKGNDVEIAFVEGFSTKLLSFSTNKKAKKIAWVHIDLLCNPWTIRQGIFKNLSEEKSVYSKYDKVVCVSKTVFEHFKKRYLLENVVQIYNPLDSEDICKKSLEKVDSQKDPNKILFLSVGRLVSQKGYDRLLHVVSRLKNENYDFNLLILGTGEEYESLKDFLIEKKLEDVVKMVGFVTNPYCYMKRADVFICSSRSEGYSLVIAEAMILGLPIISTYCSGPNELLEEGKYGILVNNSEEGIYEGMKRVLDNPFILEKLKEKSLDRAKIFNVSKPLSKIENLL